MAWATPRTWVTGEVVTSALMNTHLRSNMLETAPAKATTAGDMFYATGPNTLTTLPISGAARKSLAANTTETALEYIDSLESLIQAQGDIIYGASANTPARLPKGSARQGLALPGASSPRQTSQEFSLSSANATARGMTVDATYAYVVDDVTEQVYVYRLSDGARQTGQEFDIHSTNTWPVGLGVGTTYAYVADRTETKVFVYQLSNGSQQTNLEFDLHTDNDHPRGMAVDATYAYVADDTDNKVYVYQLSDGARQTGREFGFHADNSNAQGIAVDSTHAYVLDHTDNKVYVYRLSDGARQTGQEFGLDVANSDAQGIGVGTTYAYVVDITDDRMYVYHLPGSYDSTPQWVATPQSLMTAQGDIIQASSANNPARLALGAAGQDLVVNPGATALTYADPVAPVATTMTELLAARSKNISLWGIEGNWVASRVHSHAAQRIGFAWCAPVNFASMTSMELVLLPRATATVINSLSLKQSAPGESISIDSESTGLASKDVTINVLTEWDVGTYFSGLSDITAGDYVSLWMQWQPGSNILVVGLKIVWVTT